MALLKSRHGKKSMRWEQVANKLGSTKTTSFTGKKCEWFEEPYYKLSLKFLISINSHGLLLTIKKDLKTVKRSFF